MARYPGATWKGDGVSGGAHIGVPWRVCLHSTETRGVPGYSDGASAPHFTYSPTTRKWVQHTDTSTAARALKNLGGGVETNRANCIQVEIVAYSARGIADIVGGLWIADLTSVQLDDIRTFLGWTSQFGVKMFWPGKQALSYAAANTPGFRMSGSEWLAFNGVCGHQHVPENTHWDPGALAWGNLHLSSPSNPIPEPPGDDTMKEAIAAMKSFGTPFWIRCKAVTGQPGGDPAYWGGTAATKPNDAEWTAAYPILWPSALLTLAAGVADPLTAGEPVRIVRA